MLLFASRGIIILPHVPSALKNLATPPLVADRVRAYVGSRSQLIHVYHLYSGVASDRCESVIVQHNLPRREPRRGILNGLYPACVSAARGASETLRAGAGRGPGRKRPCGQRGKECVVASPETPVDTRDMYMVHTMFRREFAALPELVRNVAAADTERAHLIHGTPTPRRSAPLRPSRT